MKKTILLIVALMCLAITLVFFALTSPRNNTKQNTRDTAPKPTPIASSILSFSPHTIQFGASGSASVDIIISTGYNEVTGVQLELKYDPNALMNVTIEPGPFLPSAVKFLDNKDVAGRYSYMLGLPPSQNPVKGTGIVAIVHFQRNQSTFQETQTTLSIMAKSLVTSLGVEGSVLKQADSLVIRLPELNTPPSQTPIETTLNPTVQQP